MLTNFHTHTWRCKHAEGDIGDFCRAATAKGFGVLGFSDHAPLPDDRWLHVRMTADQAPQYLAAIDAAKPVFKNLVILKGFECEYDDCYVNWFREELLGRMGAEYLIAGCHWFPHRGEWLGLHGRKMEKTEIKSYAEYCVQAMESGLFTFLAHPDVFGIACPDWNPEAKACARLIGEAAAAFNVPLEINALGLRRKPLQMSNKKERAPYPWRPFWEIVSEYPVEVVISSDAHSPEHLIQDLDKAEALATELKLKITRLPHLWQKTHCL